MKKKNKYRKYKFIDKGYRAGFSYKGEMYVTSYRGTPEQRKRREEIAKKYGIKLLKYDDEK